MPKFTDRFLSSFKVEPGSKDRLIFDADCPGMGVRATAKGTRSFLVQWTDPATKRKHREPLGIWGSITLEQARKAARVRLGEVAKGVNPAAERIRTRAEAEAKRAEEALTLETLIDDWATRHLIQRRPRYATEAKRALRFAFHDCLRKPASRLGRSDVIDRLDKIANGGKAIMAAQTIAYGRACFAWAEKREKVTGNPFRGLPIPVVGSERDRVLTESEVAEVWAAMETLEYPFGPFYRMAILTLQRREEVAGMRWSEISDDFSTWTIPSSRMKNGRPHDVHLAEPARAVLRTIPRIEGRDLIFSTTGATPVSGFSKAKTALDAAMARVRGEIEAKTERKTATPWRLHDFRRTGVSTLARLGFDSIVVDKLLAHQPGKLRGVAAVYQRHEFAKEQAAALDAWAAHVIRPGAAAANVIKLHGGRQ
jgi:integrase